MPHPRNWGFSIPERLAQARHDLEMYRRRLRKDPVAVKDSFRKNFVDSDYEHNEHGQQIIPLTKAAWKALLANLGYTPQDPPHQPIPARRRAQARNRDEDWQRGATAKCLACSHTFAYTSPKTGTGHCESCGSTSLTGWPYKWDVIAVYVERGKK